MRLLQSSLLKLTRRPATRRTFLLLVGFLVLIYVSLGLSARGSGPPDAGIASMLAFPEAHGSLAGMLLIFCGMAGAAYAGVVAGSEWGWNTFRVALTRGVSRPRYVIALFAAIAILALASWVVLYLLGTCLILVAAGLAGTGAGDPLASPASLALLIAAGGLAALMEVAIGFGVAFVARSPVAGVAAVVGLFFAERFAQMFVPSDLLRFAPISAAEALVTGAARASVDSGIVFPLAMTAVYLLAAVALAGFAARRAQVA